MRFTLAKGMCGSFPGSRGVLLFAVTLFAALTVTLAAIGDGTEIKHLLVSFLPKIKMAQTRPCDLIWAIPMNTPP
jgi:hypothetical protein